MLETSAIELLRKRSKRPRVSRRAKQPRSRSVSRKRRRPGKTHHHPRLSDYADPPKQRKQGQANVLPFDGERKLARRSGVLDATPWSEFEGERGEP